MSAAKICARARVCQLPLEYGDTALQPPLILPPPPRPGLSLRPQLKPLAISEPEADAAQAHAQLGAGHPQLLARQQKTVFRLLHTFVGFIHVHRLYIPRDNMSLNHVRIWLRTRFSTQTANGRQSGSAGCADLGGRRLLPQRRQVRRAGSRRRHAPQRPRVRAAAARLPHLRL